MSGRARKRMDRGVQIGRDQRRRGERLPLRYSRPRDEQLYKVLDREPAETRPALLRHLREEDGSPAAWALADDLERRWGLGEQAAGS